MKIYFIYRGNNSLLDVTKKPISCKDKNLKVHKEIDTWYTVLYNLIIGI